MSKSRDQNLLDLDYIRELAKVFKRYELDEIEIESGDQRVLLRRGDVAPAPVVGAPVPMVTAHVPMAAPAPAPAPAPGYAGPASTGLRAPDDEPDEEPAGDFITSPFVGTFYRASRPDAPPFASEGKRIEAGQTVCVVEAMKLFNEIEAEFPCIVDEVLVENGQAVEFATKLFRVRKL
jgi:acetyl-CoA carboxylase biotin carboxyl carrier protein